MVGLDVEDHRETRMKVANRVRLERRHLDDIGVRVAFTVELGAHRFAERGAYVAANRRREAGLL